MRIKRGFTGERSWRDWLWLALGIACLALGLNRSFAREKVDGSMIDQFHWSRLQTAALGEGESLSLAGYMLPLTDETAGQPSEVTKFILVPYLPSCTQRPPPLSNQTVLVETSPIRFSTDPVVVRGQITRLKSIDRGAGYRLQAHGLRPWNHGQFSNNDED